MAGRYHFVSGVNILLVCCFVLLKLIKKKCQNGIKSLPLVSHLCVLQRRHGGWGEEDRQTNLQKVLVGQGSSYVSKSLSIYAKGRIMPHQKSL